MEYRENVLCYEDYCRLRESVGWADFSEEQTQAALNNSLFTVAVFENNQAIGMGRLIGDGMYLIIADIVVSPSYQKKGIGSKITNMLIEHAAKKLPSGGRTSIQLISEKGKEAFYEKLGFKRIPNDFCGFGMRKVIRK